MQPTKRILNDPAPPLRSKLLRWLCAAAWLAVTGAAAPMGLAQAPAGADDEAGSPTEPEVVTQSSAASRPDSEPAAVWNHRRTAPSGVDGQLRRLAADLKLDAGQQVKIRPILVAQREQMQRLHLDAQLTPAERQRRILALGDRSADQIRAQLSDAQRAQFIQPRTATVVAQAPSSVRRSPAAAPAPGVSKEVKP